VRGVRRGERVAAQRRKNDEAERVALAAQLTQALG
jgi:hypothetical protein